MNNISKICIIVLSVFFISVFLSSEVCSQVKKYQEAEKLYLEGDSSQFDYVLKKYIDSYYTDTEAALTLGRMGNPDAVKYLAEAVLDKAPTAKAAVTALGMIKDKKAVPALIRVIREDREYAKEAVEILKILKDKRAVPVLKYVVRNRKSFYLEALDALGAIGDPESTDLVMEILKENPTNETEKIQFKIEHPDLQEDKVNRRERIINVSEPSVDITNYTITYDNLIKVFYKLNDFDSDTLNIIPYYSLNNGRSWTRANVIGKMEKIPRLEYDNSILWQPGSDLGKFSTEDLLLRIVPIDDPLDITRGFPAVITVPIDTTTLEVKNLPASVNGEVEIFVLNPVPAGGTRRDKSFHFSLNDGSTWSLASVERGLPKDDTLIYYWQSESDLPGSDIENVMLRVSSVGGKNFGKTVVTNKFHLDNNTIPSVELGSLSIDENNIVLIDYQVFDIERDPVTLVFEYSVDKGISWMLATMSGNLSDLPQEKYQGQAAWYYNFDISDMFADSVRVKITPRDNNIGISNESEDFMANQIRSVKLAQGVKPGDLELKYTTNKDVTNLVGKYSTDGGVTWKDASFRSYEELDENDEKSVKFKWNVDSDILGFRKKLDYSIRTIKGLKDLTVIPDLIRLSLYDTSPLRSERERSLSIKEIFNEREKWVVDGMLQSLIHDSEFIRDWAYNYLRLEPEPRVIAALRDYDNYWDQRREYEVQILAVQKEIVYQAWIDREIRPKPVDEADLTNFIVKQGFTELQAKKMLKSLALDTETKRLNKLLLEGKIDEDTYLQERDKHREELKKVKEAEIDQKRQKREVEK